MAAPRPSDPYQRALRTEQIAAVLAALRAGEHVEHDEGRGRMVAWHGEHGRFVEVERDTGLVQRSVLDEAEMVGAMQRRPRPFHRLLERLCRQRLVEHLLDEDRPAALAALGELVAMAPTTWASLRACLPNGAAAAEAVELADLDGRIDDLLVAFDDERVAAARAFLLSLLRLPVPAATSRSGRHREPVRPV